MGTTIAQAWALTLYTYVQLRETEKFEDIMRELERVDMMNKQTVATWGDADAHQKVAEAALARAMITPASAAGATPETVDDDAVRIAAHDVIAQRFAAAEKVAAEKGGWVVVPHPTTE